MLFVSGTMTFAPETLDQFRKDVAAMRDKVIAEDGCMHYSLLVEDEDAGIVNAHELWRDDDALRAHLKQPWIVSFFDTYAPQLKDMSLHLYDVAGQPRDLSEVRD